MDDDQIEAALTLALEDTAKGTFAALIVATPDHDDGETTFYQIEITSLSHVGAEGPCKAFCDQLRLLSVPAGEG